MSVWLFKLGNTSFKRKWIVLSIWIVVLGGIIGLSTQSKPMSNSFSMPGIPSVDALNKLGAIQGGDSGDDPFTVANIQMVIKSPEGTKLDSKENILLVNKAIEDIKNIKVISENGDEFEGIKNSKSLINPAITQEQIITQIIMAGRAEGKSETEAALDAKKMLQINDDKTVEYIDISLIGKLGNKEDDENHKKIYNQIQESNTTLTNKGFEVEYGGTVPQTVEMGEFGGSSEMIGILIAAIILILTFGSFVAWGLPIIAAVFGVGIGLTGISAATILFDINSTAPTLATMIGLAVGIDYSLFILSRYRHEYKKRGDRQLAAGIAVGTAGSAVVFAGLTVLVSLLALSVVRIPFLTQMALGAAFTVLVAILIAITLLPALMGIFNTKTFAAKIPFIHAPDSEMDLEKLHKSSNGQRVISIITKFAPAVFGLVLVGMLALAAPVKDIHLSLPGPESMPKESTMKKSYEILREGFGPGAMSPLMVVAESKDIKSLDAGLKDLVKVANQKTDIVSRAFLAQIDSKSGLGLVQIVPKFDTSSEESNQIVHDIRGMKEDYKTKYNMDLEVTGETAIYIDVSEKLSDSLIPYLALVVIISLLILLLVFRSLLVPLTAALGFILSVAATFGATVAIFQKGFLGLITETQPIVSFLPIMVIGIVFGLAMDYQVFLVTRMREEYVQGLTAKEAVKMGYTHSIRIVVAAASIMIFVFLPFMLNGQTLVQEIGFALAAGVFFDAFLVRMVLIPATLYLFGENAWYLPKWLDKILPKVDIEGEKLVELIESKELVKS